VNGIQIKSSEIGETDMVIDCRTRLTVHYDLLSFLKDINCTSMQFKFLCFWGRHPKAKLSLHTIASALDSSTIDLRDAIANLVEKGILTAQRNNDDLITYALSDQQTQEYIDELGSLDWSQTMNLEKQLKKETVSLASKSE
jgi:predicted DNA-binding transcriptional regulator